MNSIDFSNPQHLSAVTSSGTVMTDQYFLGVYEYSQRAAWLLIVIKPKPEDPPRTPHRMRPRLHDAIESMRAKEVRRRELTVRKKQCECPGRVFGRSYKPRMRPEGHHGELTADYAVFPGSPVKLWIHLICKALTRENLSNSWWADQSRSRPITEGKNVRKDYRSLQRISGS